jgi:hypothetical protein
MKLNTAKHDWKMEPILKPKYILDYSGKKWVQQIGFSYVHGILKSFKWCKKLLLHILDIALLSAHALYLVQNKSMPL